MTRTPTSEVRRRLGASKLIALRAPANVAVGDRRSKAIGAGIEFAQYRDYEPGDDLRHLDRHVYARHGRVVIRQQHLEQRLRVSVLLDASGSMAVEPATWTRAVAVAAMFGELALNGSDQVTFGVARGTRVDWGSVASRSTHLGRELARLAAVEPEGGPSSMEAVATASLSRLAQPGMLVVISDWLVNGFAEALRTWRVRDQEVVAVQVLGGLETLQGAGESGWLRLVDSESGAVLERRVDAQAWGSYRAAVSEWSEQVRSAVWAAEGRWLSINTSAATDDVIGDLRRLGIMT